MNKVLLSSKSSEWETPQNFYDKLNQEFNFTLDPCCTKENKKCDKYYTVKEDGLKQNWEGNVVFCNPPYGREISKWIEKAHNESLKGNTIVCLLPARTDTKWFHNFIYGNAEIRFLKGRLKFSGHKWNAPFPNMVVIFKG